MTLIGVSPSLSKAQSPLGSGIQAMDRMEKPLLSLVPAPLCLEGHTEERS